eukprot:snap_masked-scaffold_15-processed-gene-5.31-mRNA-1 protein AED:1.00 eAED:1.00 QI:0/0/0/0/1/1/2/0/60
MFGNKSEIYDLTVFEKKIKNGGRDLDSVLKVLKQVLFWFALNESIRKDQPLKKNGLARVA